MHGQLNRMCSPLRGALAALKENAMSRSIQATLAFLACAAMLAVSTSAIAQRQGGGGGGGGRAYHGGGGGGAYQGGGYRGYHGHGGYRGYHGHSHSSLRVGVAFGAPFWYPWPGYAYSPYPAYPYYPYAAYPYPYYGYPAAVSVPAPVYIERDRDVAASDSPYWYYCRESDAYYPYVKQCSGSWERVPAQPAR